MLGLARERSFSMRCLETIIMQQFCLEHLQLIICICFQPPDSVNHEMLDQVKEAGFVEKENVPNKKRHRPKALKSPKVKKDMRGPRAPKPEGSPSVQLVRSAKKTTEIMINGINIDISVIPIPVCLCMGTPQQCYRWVCGGWLLACCLTCISMYPLPMSTKRHGSRIAGRKE